MEQGIWNFDEGLLPYRDIIKQRANKKELVKQQLTNGGSLFNFANGHHYFGLHKNAKGWIFREWAPNAKEIYIIGDFNDWKPEEQYKLIQNQDGIWEKQFAPSAFKHLDLYKLKVKWLGGEGDRIPAYCKRAVQDEITKVFCAQVWQPEEIYQWKHNKPIQRLKNVLIYEIHIGMATEREEVGTFKEFRENLLPYIYKNGYNTLQIMAIQEHPYYGSFGYHVSNFYAVSSRFGTPEELKQLIDEAHGMGIAVLMDIVHSHAVKNTEEGLGLFDGSEDMYFHQGERRNHTAWDSLCFDYGKPEVLHFLLSNIKYWMEEFRFDGFRFDGVTSMLYLHHGLGKDFLGYADYFDLQQDEDAITYFMLANELIHNINHNALSIAEEMSGYPGLAAPLFLGGLGFDYRLAMGIPDFWIRMIKDKKDEDWDVGNIRWELTNKRPEEKTISYVESHDQALVGDKTIIFRLIDEAMYFHMQKSDENMKVDRGMALHKIIRLLTLSLSGGGYLTFMGNEFGHPEWIDFPRAGNDWSYKYARRQWHLAQSDDLKYKSLLLFDNEMVKTVNNHIDLSNDPIKILSENTENQVLAYARGNVVFVVNFNPIISFEHYKIPTKRGVYHIILNSDDEKFGGFNRIDNQLSYQTKTADVSYLQLYIPNRTIMVLKREEA